MLVPQAMESTAFAVALDPELADALVGKQEETIPDLLPGKPLEDHSGMAPDAKIKEGVGILLESGCCP